jgi:hypothetical protein
MRIIILGKTRYTVRDDRTDIMAAHAKCTGKHKLVKSKGAEKRLYPVYGVDMSTAKYVATYEKLNKKIMPWDWQPLRADPCLAPVGEDSAWEVDHASDI